LRFDNIIARKATKTKTGVSASVTEKRTLAANTHLCLNDLRVKAYSNNFRIVGART
jgi:hypothetical protein